MNEKEMKVLVFSINDQYYATDIIEVERILGYESPTKLPDSPDFIEGIINYEGTILPILNLAKRFNIPNERPKDDSKIIIVKEDGSKIGIVVDVVSEVRNVKPDNIEEAPNIIAGISKRYIKGLIKLDKDIIIFLNLSAVLTKEEKESILK